MKPVLERYPKYFTGPQPRYFYVGGEVKMPGVKVYPGAITVTKAIETANGFTEYANKKMVIVSRPGGRIEIVNAVKAAKDPDQDPPIYPGDKIAVKRRFFAK